MGMARYHVISHGNERSEYRPCQRGLGEASRLASPFVETLALNSPTHGQRFVELRILKRRKPQQSVSQCGWQLVLGDIDLIAKRQFKPLGYRNSWSFSTISPTEPNWKRLPATPSPRKVS